jgi:hypothetical protein
MPVQATKPFKFPDFTATWVPQIDPPYERFVAPVKYLKIARQTIWYFFSDTLAGKVSQSAGIPHMVEPVVRSSKGCRF